MTNFTIHGSSFFNAYHGQGTSRRSEPFQYSPFYVTPCSTHQPHNMTGAEGTHQGSLDGGPHTPSFFEESLSNVGEDGIRPTSQIRHIPRPSCGPFRPLNPGDRAPMFMKTDNNAQVPAPGILEREVDAAAYAHVGYHELATARVGYSAPSPTSVGSSATGPLTPDSESSFVEKYFQSSAHLENPVALGFLGRSIKQEDPDVAPYHPPSRCFNNPPHGLPLSDRQIWSVAGLQMNQANGAILNAPDMNSRHSQFGSLTHHLPVAMYGSVNPQVIRPSSPQESEYPAEQSITEYSDLDERSLASSGQSHRSHSSITSSVTVAKPAPKPAPTRNKQDDLLVRWRAEGLSYKEIKGRLRLKEAESTLRGRHRTLTKAKSERVRNPIWTIRDEELLCRAVDHFRHAGTGNTSQTSRKIPWQQVSKWMQKHGGTYGFAAAASSKKYEELRRDKRLY